MRNLDLGFQFAFATVKTSFGDFTGQIVGVYNEDKFMWHPTEFSTITVFTCSDSLIPLNSFSVEPGQDPAIFTLSSRDILSIEVMAQPRGLVEYREYMRGHGYTYHIVPLEVETYIAEAWTTYHSWEDGRSNYAWDLEALNNNLMTYSRFGERNTDYEIFGKNVLLPISGRIVLAVDKEEDNPPDLSAAIELSDCESGQEVDLTEKPQNGVEVEVGGLGSPCKLRLLHLQQNSIPPDVQVGELLPAGTIVGKAGNSGTTYVPHLHSAFGFTDNSSRFWSLPMEWTDVEHRILLPYAHGYQHGPYHQHDYYYPKLGNLVKTMKPAILS